MIITCGECDSSFVLDDSLVKSSGSKVRCSNCKHVFIVYPAKPMEKQEPQRAVASRTADSEKSRPEMSYDLAGDPDLSKAVAAINEDELEFTEEELGQPSPKVKAAAPSKDTAFSTPVAAAAAVAETKDIPSASVSESLPDIEKSMDEGDEILDFADFEMDMDEGSSLSEASMIEEELQLDFDDEDNVPASKASDEDDLDLHLDSDEGEEELDFSDLELELDGIKSSGDLNDTEVIGTSMSMDETDSADTVVVDDLGFDLSDFDKDDKGETAPPPLPDDEDMTFDAGEGLEEDADSLMVDDELDFSDLERELDGISDEPATVDELDLGLESDADGVEAETILMDGDDLDFSEFEFEADGADKAAETAKKAAQVSKDAEEELDFSNLADILDSEPSPIAEARNVDDDLELELDMDLEAGGSSGSAHESDDEEELDFSDLEDLLDDLDQGDVHKEETIEDINLELDMEEDERKTSAPAAKSKAPVHDEEDLDFSDVEAMLDSGEDDEELELSPAGDDSDFELELEDGDDELSLKLESEEDEDIELELDLGDAEASDDDERLTMEEQDEEELPGAALAPRGDIDKALEKKAGEKKKIRQKPKRKARGRGKDYAKYVGYVLLALLILFILYMSKNMIEKVTGVAVPISIAPLEQVRDSLSAVPGLGSFVKPQDQDPQGKFKLKTSRISGKIIPSSTLGDLFVITGNVQNMYPETRNSISLVCKLFGREGKVSQTKLFYAGNVIPEVELANMDEGMIKKRIQNRLGDNGINAKVRPNQDVPFMVVFTRLGDNLTEFSVEPAGSLEGSAIE